MADPSLDTGDGLSAGQTLGDFRLVSELGRGGMGVVWEAEQISLNRSVALKLLPRSFLSMESDVDRFKREAEAGGRIQHPGIVAVYQVGEVEGHHFIAQELVPGGRTLADLIAEHRKVVEVSDGYYADAAELIAKVADALQAAHDEGVIHRDVKPQNILLTPDGEPKVADFGLAKVEDALSLSMTGDFAGTPYYMSPEQAMAKRMGIDQRTDVFSLGAVMYEALTLTLPFQGDTSQQVLGKVVTQDPPDPQRLRSRVPKDLGVICIKALEKERQRRFSSMGELAADVRRHLNNEPIKAKPPTPVQRAAKWARRNPVKSVSGAVAGVAVAAIGYLLLLVVTEMGHTRKERDRALANQEWAEEERDRANVERDRVVAAERKHNRAASAAGISAAQMAYERGDIAAARTFLDNCPATGKEAWEWQHLDLQLSLPLVSFQGVAHASNAGGTAWDERGDRVAAATNDGRVVVWDAETGEKVAALEQAVQQVDVSWGPESRSLATVGAEGVNIWDTTSWNLIDTYPNLPGSRIDINSTGRYLVVKNESRSPDILTIDVLTLDTGEVRTLDLSSIEENSPGFWGPIACSPNGKHLAFFGGAHLSVWDLSDARLVTLIEHGASSMFGSLSWSPQSDRICFSNYRTVSVVSCPSGEVVQTLDDIHEPTALDWIPAREQVAILESTGDVRVWDLSTGETRNSFRSDARHSVHLQVSPDGERVLLDGRGIQIWDLYSSRPSWRFPIGRSRHVEVLTFSPDDSEIHISNGEGHILTLDATSGAATRVNEHIERSIIRASALSPDGAILAYGYTSIELQDTISGEHLLSVNVDEEDIQQVFEGWPDVEGGTPGTLPPRGVEISGIAWSPDGEQLVAALEPGFSPDTRAGWRWVLVTIDANTGEKVRTLVQSHVGEKVDWVAWSPDGLSMLVVTTGFNDTSPIPMARGPNRRGNRWRTLNRQSSLTIFDSTSGKKLRTIAMTVDSLGGAAWDPASTRIATVSEIEGSRGYAATEIVLRVWDVATGGHLYSYSLGHPRRWQSDDAFSYTYRVAWSHDGRSIAVGSDFYLEIIPTTLKQLRSGWRNELRWRGVGSTVVEALRANGDTHNSGVLGEVVLEGALPTIRGNNTLSLEARTSAAILARASVSRDDAVSYMYEARGEIVDKVLAGQEGDLVAALRWARQSIALLSSRPSWEVRCRHVLAMALIANGFQDEGAAELAKVLALSEGWQLHGDPWRAVNPHRENMGSNVALALRLTLGGVAVAPGDVPLRNVHAWALFANGLYDEALAASKTALELAPEAEKEAYQGYLDRLRSMIAEAQQQPAEAGAGD